METDQFPSNVHPAAQNEWSLRDGQLRMITPVWEWVASVATILLLAALFTPQLVLCASDPLKTARLPTYSMIVGLAGSAGLIVALGLRANEYHLMTHWRYAVYILQWCSYGIMAAASLFLIIVKYTYAVPRARARGNLVVGMMV